MGGSTASMCKGKGTTFQAPTVPNRLFINSSCSCSSSCSSSSSSHSGSNCSSSCSSHLSVVYRADGEDDFDMFIECVKAKSHHSSSSSCCCCCCCCSSSSSSSSSLLYVDRAGGEDDFDMFMECVKAKSHQAQARVNSHGTSTLLFYGRSEANQDLKCKNSSCIVCHPTKFLWTLSPLTKLHGTLL